MNTHVNEMFAKDFFNLSSETLDGIAEAISRQMGTKLAQLGVDLFIEYIAVLSIQRFDLLSKMYKAFNTFDQLIKRCSEEDVNWALEIEWHRVIPNVKELTELLDEIRQTLRAQIDLV